MPSRQSLSYGIGTFWRSVKSAVSRGIDVFGFATRTQAAYEQAGLPAESIDVGVIDQMASTAAAMQLAGDRFAAAAVTDQIDNTMVAKADWSMPLAQFNVTPRYRAETEIIMERPDGTTYSTYRVITGLEDISMTKSALVNILYANALGLTTTSPTGIEQGDTVKDIGEVQLTVAPAL